MADQALNGPGQPGGGGLVASHQQSHQLIAQLTVGHRRTVLVLGRQHQRQDVLSFLQVAGRAPLRDLLIDQAVDRLEQPLERPELG